MKETPEARAVKIAAEIMVAAGLCRYDTPLKCRRVYTSADTCDVCITRWLMNKAKSELKKESMSTIE